MSEKNEERQDVAQNMMIIPTCRTCGTESHDIEFDDWAVVLEVNTVEVEEEDGVDEVELAGGQGQRFCSQQCFREWVEEQVESDEPEHTVFIEGIKNE